MKTNYLFSALCAAVIFASCEKQSDRDPVYASDIHLSASIDAMTRVSGNSFENGDKISVYAVESDKQESVIINNNVNTFDGATWIPTERMEWKDNATALDFFAIYPTTNIVPNQPTPFTLTDNMTSNDLLVATKASQMPTSSSVDLAFEHIMSKVTVNLQFNHEFVTPPTVSRVVLSSKKTATINYPAKSVQTNGLVSDMELTPVGDSYQGVAAPQVLAANVAAIVVTINGENYTYTPTDAITLAAKQNNTFNLIVGEGRKIVLSDNLTIAPWGSDQPITGGAAKK